MLKIQRTENAIVTFNLSGRLESERIGELKELFALEPKGTPLALDLKELMLVDREAVIFLAECEAKGIELENCPAYIREWVIRERGES